MKNTPFIFAGITINPGEHKVIQMPVPTLYTQTALNIPVHIIHGKKKGPVLLLNACLHGDEINGVEIIRLLLNHVQLRNIRGTLIAIPIANIYGFLTLSRYLPDRRDLNRAFPGHNSGSLASRLANILMKKVVHHCTHIIDFHTGNKHLENYPQIRTNLSVKGAYEIAKAFNVPVILNSKSLDGSLREAAKKMRKPILVYEGGEALRFNEVAIQMGLTGTLNVMNKLKMIKHPKIKKHKKIKPKIAISNGWIRSPESGVFHQLKPLGRSVKKGQLLGIIGNPFAKKEYKILSPVNGIFIGKNTLPLVNEGDALFHMAYFEKQKVKGLSLYELKYALEKNPPILF